MCISSDSCKCTICHCPAKSWRWPTRGFCPLAGVHSVSTWSSSVLPNGNPPTPFITPMYFLPTVKLRTILSDALLELRITLSMGHSFPNESSLFLFLKNFLQFTFGRAGSSSLHRLFSSCGAWASHCRAFSCVARALECTGSVVAACGL